MKIMKQTKKQKVLGNFIIQETLGKGTFGKVKLGIYIPTKEKVAVKILEKSKLKERDDIDRVMREMEIIKNIRHENIVQVYEILEDSENYYIIMEFCEDGELFNHIVKKKRLSEDETSYYYYQLINGLETIHTYNVVHRDLKPENLLLSKDKKLKIIDFGLSNYFRHDSSLLATPCGSPCYASPEMVAGNKYNGYMIDVWSTGIILFAMICGYLPFEDPENEKLFAKILECNLSFPNHVSNTVRDLIKKIIVKNPQQRIKINEIKKHPFYLHGKSIYEKYFPKSSSHSLTQTNNVLTQTNILTKKLSLDIPETTKNKKKIHFVYDSTGASPSNNLNFNNFISGSNSPQTEDIKYEVLHTIGNTKNFENTKHNFFRFDENLNLKSKFKNISPSINKKQTLTINANDLFKKNSLNLNKINVNINEFEKKLKQSIKKVSPIIEAKTNRINKKDVGSYNNLEMNNDLKITSKSTNTNMKNLNFYDLNFNVSSISKKLKETNLNNFSKNLPTINKLKLGKKPLMNDSTGNERLKTFNNVGPVTNTNRITDNIYLLTDGNEPNENSKRKLNDLFNSTFNGKFSKNNNANNSGSNFNKIKTTRMNMTPSKMVTNSINNFPINKQFNSTFLRIKEKVKNLYYKEYLSRIGGSKS